MGGVAYVYSREEVIAFNKERAERGEPLLPVPPEERLVTGHGLSRGAVAEMNPTRVAQGLPRLAEEDTVVEDSPGLHWPVCQACNGTGHVIENNTSGVKCELCKGRGRVAPTGHGYVLVHKDCPFCLSTMRANLGLVNK